jgi:MOSC domain-containing protein YiiM
MGVTEFHLASLNVGQPQQLLWNNRKVTSGISKRPVTDDVFLSVLNFEGDVQADKKNHGGKDKAVSVYPSVHYLYWKQHWDLDLAPASFGENLAVDGLTEETVKIGDVFQLGEALLQISQPRMPCYKVGMNLKQESIPDDMVKTGYTGFYMRVLEPGFVEAGSTLKLVKKSEFDVTVAEVNLVTYHQKNDMDKLKKICALDDLAGGWRDKLIKQLKSLSDEKEKE